jgi:solute carrier family 25 (mitochondrial dicarboxylate transporter), member 10
MSLIDIIDARIGGAVGNPADVLNVRMQNDMSLPLEQRRNYKHALDGLIRLIREEGPSSLMRGLFANTSRGVLMTAGQLASYDEFKKLLLKTGVMGDHLGTHFTASFMAGFVATTMYSSHFLAYNRCSPIDVIKTRIMNAKGKSGGAVSILKGAVKTEGIQFMFRGWTPSFVRLCPQTVVTFIVLEQQKKWWKIWTGQ